MFAAQKFDKVIFIEPCPAADGDSVMSEEENSLQWSEKLWREQYFKSSVKHWRSQGPATLGTGPGSVAVPVRIEASVFCPTLERSKVIK